MTAFLEYPKRMVPHDAVVGVSCSNRASEVVDQQRQILWRPAVGRRQFLKITTRTNRTGQCDFRVRDQLLVVLESVVIVGTRRRFIDGRSACNDAGIYRGDRICGKVVIAMSFGRLWVARIAVTDELAGQNRRPGRFEMAEPIRPCNVVGDPSKTRSFGQTFLRIAASD